MVGRNFYVERLVCVRVLWLKGVWCLIGIEMIILVILWRVGRRGWSWELGERSFVSFR